MTRTIFFVIIIASILIVPSCKENVSKKIEWKKIENTSIPIPPKGHPRLYLNSLKAREFKNRVNDPVLEKLVQRLKEQAGQTTQYKVEWDAVQYLVSKDKTLGRQTIDTTLALLKRTTLPEKGDAARVTGRMMVTGAIVYDWLYSLLTQEEKASFIKELIRLAETLECGYPPTKQGSVTGHSSEHFIMRDMLSAGIAVYDEYPEMYDHAAEKFFSQHLPARNWLYNGNAYHQGDSYGMYRYSCDTYPLMIYNAIGVDSIYNPQQQYVPYFYIYTTRPDGQRLRSGDTYAHSASPGKPWPQYVGILFTASYYNDGILLQQWYDQGQNDGNENIFQFLWWKTDLQPKPVNTLPLSRYFDAPFGWMAARTGWDENSVIAEMKINEYNFNNHQHADAGSFQIYYKGSLAVESGLYNGTAGGYGNPHNVNYSWRTISHNSLLIYNPDEEFPSYRKAENDGGQRLVNQRNEPGTIETLMDPTNGYKTGEILTHSIGPDQQTPDYSYLKGDITKAYSDKVKEVKRSFVFFNLKNSSVPAAMVVFDKVVSSSPGYKKYWLMHSMEEPVIQGTDVTINNAQLSKLVNTTILPAAEDLIITPVGGEGKEYWVFGVNYANEQRSNRENSYERVPWRVEISPKKAAKENYYLNVMQVMDASGAKLEIKKVEDESVTGIRISDRIVLFSKNSAPATSSIKFSISDPGTFKILITDLASGTWKVMKGNQEVSTLPVTTDDGTLYFEGSQGQYQINRIAN